MCGLLYSRVFNPERINTGWFEGRFKEALALMRYRGPDATGYLRHNDHFFGHVRLSIIDVNATSNQPVADDSHVMIFNGEIYNYKTLEPASFSDTLTLFRQLKTVSRPFAKIRGMFAIGFYSKAEDTVVFYRDFFGEKPLYYYRDHDLFIASSTIKSICYLLKSCGKPVALNRQRIINDYFLFGFIREPETVYEKIRLLEAGHALTLAAGTFAVRPIPFDLCPVPIQATDYLHNAISSTDVPATLLLSGGVDSAMVLHACNRVQHRFSSLVYRSSDPGKDESNKSVENFKKMVKNEAGKWQKFVVNNSSDEWTMYNRYITCLEQPTTDGVNLFNILSEYADVNPSKLILTGLGGDELYGGYNSFRNWPWINKLTRLGPAVRTVYPKINRFVEGKKILADWNPHLYYFLYRLDYDTWTTVFSGDPDILKSSFDYFLKSLASSYAFLPKQGDDLHELKRAECTDYMRNQLLRDNDNISMHFSIESRSPLLDPEKFTNAPDRRKWMHRILKEKYGLRFGRKQGFTFTPSAINDTGENETAETLRRYLDIKIRNKKLLMQRKLRHLSGWFVANHPCR